VLFALLLNPEAQRGRHSRLWPALTAALAAGGNEVRPLVGRNPQHAEDLAHAAVAEGVDALIAAGGDGTLAGALQAAATTDTPLGIVPLGTGNDNARMLGITSPVHAVRCIRAMQPRSVDVGRIDDDAGARRYFLSVAAIGYDSQVGERMRGQTWPRGQTQYLLSAIAELRNLGTPDFTLTLDGQRLAGPTVMAAVGNGAYYGGGMKVCPNAKMDDGLLHLTWVHAISRSRLLGMTPDLYRGTHVKRHYVTQLTGRQLRVEAAGQVAYAEGDRVADLPVTLRVLPGALRVLAPAAK